MPLREVEDPPSLRDLLAAPFSTPSAEQTLPALLQDVQLVGSGKGALSLVLSYLRKTGVMENKLAEVLVPDWIGYWVYNEIQSKAFPAKQISARARAVLVYHQYGFPQNLDLILEEARSRKLLVIEDCAHALGSTYKGRALGSQGDFAIFSYSKYLFCFALGGVKSKCDDFRSFVDETLKQAPIGLSRCKDGIKWLHERHLSGRNLLPPSITDTLLGMSYSFYGKALKPTRLAEAFVYRHIENEVTRRKLRYSYFRQQTERFGLCDHLEAEGVVPYVIPLRYTEPAGPRLLQALSELQVESGLYQFDMNRNVFNPRFEPVLRIPCYSKLSDSQFESIVNAVIQVQR